jgi:hypothetical protein
MFSDGHIAKEGYPSPCPRITGATIEILEREGLAAALNEAAKVMAGHGNDKHGFKRWTFQDIETHREKCVRHISQGGKDAESGLLSSAHGVVRALFKAAMELGA